MKNIFRCCYIILSSKFQRLAQWSDVGGPGPEVKNYICFCHIIDSISLLGGGPPFVINFLSALSQWITAPYFARWYTYVSSGSDITIIYECNLLNFAIISCGYGIKTSLGFIFSKYTVYDLISAAFYSLYLFFHHSVFNNIKILKKLINYVRNNVQSTFFEWAYWEPYWVKAKNVQRMLVGTLYFILASYFIPFDMCKNEYWMSIELLMQTSRHTCKIWLPQVGPTAF